MSKSKTRIYLDGDDVVVTYLDPISGRGSTTTIYYVPANGGYVRERGGTQVCTALANYGDALMATRGTLERVIRREHARRVRQVRGMLSW